MFMHWPDICEPVPFPSAGRGNVSERMNHDRLRRVELEVETLLADVREQVQRLRTTVDRMRALRGGDPEPAYGYGRSGFSPGGTGRSRRTGTYQDPG